MKLILSIMVLFGGFQALAADGSSGCGPGWYILKDNSLVSSSLRATTNGILFPVYTIGMTIGTSNCTKHSIVQTEKESLYFVTQNVHALESDSALAQGEYLNALALTIGCPVEAQGQFRSSVQSQHNKVFSNKAPEAVLTNIYKIILTEPELTRQCSLHNLG